MNEFSEYYTFNEYMKKNKLTPNEEDYMEIIYRIYLEKEHITVSDISKYLNVRPASVSNMIKKLAEKELLIYERYGYVKLNTIGITVGKKLLYRHNTIMDFLRLIGIDDKLHEETEKMEHTISENMLSHIEICIKFLSQEEVLSKFNQYKATSKK